ncbi:MAG: hypothetical protein Q4F72_10495 [Desulfovibrionaceae bacterium]|nr:hypothetical protein [Desulfovibrionaceae bacterium]
MSIEAGSPGEVLLGGRLERHLADRRTPGERIRDNLAWIDALERELRE